MVIVKVIAGPGNEQQAQLVRSGEGAKGRLGDTGTGHFEVLRFEGRLGADRVVVVAEAIISKDALSGIVDEAIVDAHILAAPIVPILQIFHRNAAHDGKPVVPFLGIEAFFIHLGLKGGQLIDIGAHSQVVVRFDAFTAGPGAAHDSTEHVERHLGVGLVQGFYLFKTRQQGRHGKVMLPGVDETAVNQRIDGQDHGVGLIGIGLDPAHETVR